MPRIYARVEGTGERVLVRIKCDYCSATIKPRADIALSGWKKWGVHDTGCGGLSDEWYCCPDCTHNIPWNAMGVVTLIGMREKISILSSALPRDEDKELEAAYMGMPSPRPGEEC